MRGFIGLNKRDVDGADELPSGKIHNPIARTVVAIPDEHAAKGFMGELLPTTIFQAEVEIAPEDFEVGHVSMKAMK
jgi:hypothetical protein